MKPPARSTENVSLRLSSRHLGLRGGVLQRGGQVNFFRRESHGEPAFAFAHAVEPGSRGASVFQPARRADWKVGVTTMRSMESFNLQNWTRIGAMSRKGAAANASPSWSAAVLCRFANATRWRKRQRTAALQDLAEHWGSLWKPRCLFGAN